MSNLTVTQANPPAATAPAPSPQGARSRAWLAAVGLLMIVHLALGVHCAWRFSVTHDEYWHLPAGLAVWKSGRFDADNLNPPLSRAWSALPLAACGVKLGEPAEPNDTTALGDHFLIENLDRYHGLYAWARIMNLVWSMLTGWVIAVWGRELFGEGAAVVGAALWYLCPVVLSNAVLVTPDACTAFFFVSTPFAAWRFAREPTGRRALIMGALLGAALLAKFTCVLLYPIVAIEWIVVRSGGGLAPIAWRRVGQQWLAALLVSLFVLNAGCLFRGTGQPLQAYRFTSLSLQAIAKTIRPLDGLWFPAPRDYVAGLDHQRSIMEAMHPVYLDGMWKVDSGFPDYYLRACAYKWSHAIQLLVLTALASSLCLRSGRKMWRAHLAALIPAALVVGIASASHMQLGIRYILPAFPLIYLFAGHVGSWLRGPRWNWGRVWVGLCLPALLFGLRYHPHHLAYFNELSGGPIDGPRHLLDSNIDWGQDLRELQAYLRTQNIESVGLAYFGMVPPARLGIHYHLPPSKNQVRVVGGVPPGWYAVSVNFVEGRPHTIRDADDHIRPADADEFGYFFPRVPIARIGWSINVYRIAQAP